MSKKQRNSNVIMESPRTVIGVWRANSKLAKASKICSIVVPCAFLGLLLLTSAFAFLPHAQGIFSGASNSFAGFFSDWLSTALMIIVIPAPFIGLMNSLFDVFSTISLGKFVARSGIDARDIYSNPLGSSKQEERLFCRAVWTYERPASRAFLFVKAGVVFMFGFIDMVCLTIMLSIIGTTMVTFSVGDIPTLIVANSVLFGILFALAIISAIFNLVTDFIIKHNSEKNMYAKI